MGMEMLDMWMLGCQRRSADGDGDARRVDGTGCWDANDDQLMEMEMLDMCNSTAEASHGDGHVGR
jgi:hypothetical protein